jgi:hypothetical protein
LRVQLLPQRALPALETAVSLIPADGMAWALLGCARHLTGRSGQAAPAFARGIELGCREVWMWFWAGATAGALGDREGLARARRELEVRNPRWALDLDEEIRKGGGIGVAGREEAGSC